MVNGISSLRKEKKKIEKMKNKYRWKYLFFCNIK
jgi:hypothetical protein